MEENAVKEVTGIRIASYGGMLLAAYQGRPVEARRSSPPTPTTRSPAGMDVGLHFADWATALLHNGLGHYRMAFAAAERAAEDDFAPFAGGRSPS